MLSGGRSAGVRVGDVLIVRRGTKQIATLEIDRVNEKSAVAKITSVEGDETIRQYDIATVSNRVAEFRSTTPGF